MAKAKVLFDFDSAAVGELTINANEYVTVVRQDVGDGWWEVRNARGDKGLVPESYCEILSRPEPSFPPPPPPAAAARSSWQQAKQPSPPVFPGGPPSWDGPDVTPKPTWNSSTTAAADTAPSWQQSNNTHVAASNQPQGDGKAAMRQQDSFEDWDDDDWDDDDSEISGDTEYQGGGGMRRDRQSSTSDSHRHGTVRKPLVGRFSAFNKQFVDAYLFDFNNMEVPHGEKKIVIIETPDGPMYKQPSQPFTCVITSPKKETKFRGMKSFIVYQIAPSFSGIQVSRRYKHFDWLHERLVEKYSTVAVPPLPEKQISGRFEEDFIQGRQRGLQLWMDRMCRHPVISQSEVLHHFLVCTESEKKWKQGKRQAEKDQFQAGRLFLTVECPATSLDAHQTDQKLEKFSKFIKVMDDSIKHITSVGENNVKKHEHSFKKEYKRIGGSLIALSKSFEYDDRPAAQNLTKAIEHTGHTYEEIGQMFQEQPRNDMRHLLEGANEYKGLLSVFPDVMSIPRGFISKIQENAGKYNESEVTAMQGRADVATYHTLAEMANFQEQRVGDFNQYMQAYIKGQIEFYRQITKKLEDTLQQYEPSGGGQPGYGGSY